MMECYQAQDFYFWNIIILLSLEATCSKLGRFRGVFFLNKSHPTFLESLHNLAELARLLDNLIEGTALARWHAWHQRLEESHFGWRFRALQRGLNSPCTRPTLSSAAESGSRSPPAATRRSAASVARFRRRRLCRR